MRPRKHQQRQTFLQPRFVSVLITTLVLSALFIAPATSQEDTAEPDSTTSPTELPSSVGWTGCVDPATGYRPVTIGQPITICFVLANHPNWATEMTYMRLNFQPIADQYSRFHVPNSYRQLIQERDTALTRTFPTNITVHAESQQYLSYQKWYFDGTDKIFPYLTAIVDVKNGVVQGITWDDACVFCTANECEQNTFGFNGVLATESQAGQPVGGCYITKDECEKLLQEGQTDCDLLLYVVWTGTDSQGKEFQSSAYRFSAFPAQSWTDRFSQNLPAFVPQSTEDLPDITPNS